MVVLNKVTEQSSAIQPIFMPQINIEDIDMEETDQQPELTTLQLILNVLDEHLDTNAVFDSSMPNTAHSSQQENAPQLSLDQQPKLSIDHFMANTLCQQFVAHPAFYSVIEKIVNDQDNFQDDLLKILQDVFPSLGITGVLSEALQFPLLADFTKEIADKPLVLNNLAATNVVSNGFEDHLFANQPSQQDNFSPSSVATIDHQLQSMDEIIMNALMQHPALSSFYEASVDESSNMLSLVQEILSDVLPSLGMTGILAQDYQTQILEDIKAEIATFLQQNAAASNQS